MEFDLKSARASIGISSKEAADAAEMAPSFYRSYESKGIIPCKYLYQIWKKYPDYPLPEDFFYYTSFSLRCNMHYHNKSQIELAKLLGYSSQGIISNFMSENIPMYELKDIFIKAFDPLIVPCIGLGDGKVKYITDLAPKGNFMKKRRPDKDLKANIKQLDVSELEGEGETNDTTGDDI